jgi:hypothetical protein
MPDEPESDLAMAVRHVAEGGRALTQQRLRILRLKADGYSTLEHEETLRAFENSLRIFEEDERRIRSKA